MNEPVATSAVRSSPSNAFAHLLLRLRGDQDAGVAYEALRQRLIRYFRVHVPDEAFDLADVAIDRLARRVDEGVEVENLPNYALGIARLVLLEARARQSRQRQIETDPTIWLAAPGADADDESRALDAQAGTALAACLRKAGAAASALILRYYSADGSERIRVRRQLAEELRISVNALRNRALRLRDVLEECVRGRLDGDAARDGKRERHTEQ